VAVCGYTASAAATARPAGSTALSVRATARPAGSTPVALSVPATARPVDPLALSVVAPATPNQLTPSELPADDAEQWSAVGGPSTRTLSGHAVGENECAKVSGADTWTQQGFSGADEQNIAVEDDFSFASPAAAHGAYAAFAPEMAGCQATSRALQSASHTTSDAEVRQTASAPSALAWERTWTGVAGMSAPGAQTDHVYLAVRGTELIVLQFTEFPGKAPAYAVSGDSQVLARLAGDPGA
jgi:hypothetical protein